MGTPVHRDIGIKMKVCIVVLFASLAMSNGQDPPPPCKELPPPPECKDQLCPGGMDDKGCPLADICLPFKDTTGCDVHCPVKCATNEIRCSNGADDQGCHLGNFCTSAKSGNFALDGETECAAHCPANCGKDEIPCPAYCPTKCAPEEMVCSNGVDPTSGCPMGSGCQLKKDGCPTVDQ